MNALVVPHVLSGGSFLNDCRRKVSLFLCCLLYVYVLIHILTRRLMAAKAGSSACYLFAALGWLICIHLESGYEVQKM